MVHTTLVKASIVPGIGKVQLMVGMLSTITKHLHGQKVVIIVPMAEATRLVMSRLTEDQKDYITVMDLDLACHDHLHAHQIVSRSDIVVLDEIHGGNRATFNDVFKDVNLSLIEIECHLN